MSGTWFFLELEFLSVFLQAQNMWAPILSNTGFYKIKDFEEDLPPRPLMLWEAEPKVQRCWRLEALELGKNQTGISFVTLLEPGPSCKPQ